MRKPKRVVVGASRRDTGCEDARMRGCGCDGVVGTACDLLAPVRVGARADGCFIKPTGRVFGGGQECESEAMCAQCLEQGNQMGQTWDAKSGHASHYEFRE
ncbi:hypothetical protein HBH47_206210 [Parastagonospora nodorum]|nr:hypothetical protein HBH47_206210 [Parastagonospora nodorum]